MDSQTPDTDPLVDIPFVDATEGGALDVARAEAGRFQAVLRAGRDCGL